MWSGVLAPFIREPGMISSYSTVHSSTDGEALYHESGLEIYQKDESPHLFI